MLQLPCDWKDFLKEETSKPYFEKLSEFVENEYSTKTIYPPKPQLFFALKLVKPQDVKVVILGQDPYINPGQAHGLCFSVADGAKCPPSLLNIYKALEYDLGITPTKNGNLEGWAQQGILMLNAILTVREGSTQSHSGHGWETFTDSIIHKLANLPQKKVFLLWGNYARKKTALIKGDQNLVLQAVHPSPLSFHHGFLQCKHFSQTNKFLQDNNLKPIDWAFRSHS